mgnify:CR=1 FL=1
MAATELLFTVEEADEGGYIASSVSGAIVTEAGDIEQVKAAVRDAVVCHFDEGGGPRLIQLRFVRDEVIAA